MLFVISVENAAPEHQPPLTPQKNGEERLWRFPEKPVENSTNSANPVYASRSPQAVRSRMVSRRQMMQRRCGFLPEQLDT